LIHNYFDPNKIIFKSLFHQNRFFRARVHRFFSGFLVKPEKEISNLF